MVFRIIGRLIGIVVAIMLIIDGVNYPVPDKYIYVSSLSSAYDSDWKDNKGSEYVGGDAYNYQMEASLKAGYVSGVLAMKAIYIVGGILLLFMSLYSNVTSKLTKSQRLLLDELLKNAQTQTKTLNALKKSSEQQTELLSIITGTDENSNEQP